MLNRLSRAAGLRALAVATLLVAPLSLTAQEQTLISGNSSFGGFGGPAFRITQAAGETMALSGGGGAFIIGSRFAIGGAGFGGTTAVDARLAGSTVRGEMDFGYGGLTLEYIVGSSKLLHPTLGLLVGGGAVSVWPNDLRPRLRDRGNESFGVVEPQVGLEMNIVRWMRIGGTVGYRAVIGSEETRLVNDQLSGASGTLVIRFGKF
jgi:hypothetical protein